MSKQSGPKEAKPVSGGRAARDGFRDWKDWNERLGLPGGGTVGDGRLARQHTEAGESEITIHSCCKQFWPAR